MQDESIGPDPFYDLEQHALLGVANFYLDCVNYDVMHDYTAPIVAPTGKVSTVGVCVCCHGMLWCRCVASCGSPSREFPVSAVVAS